MRWLSSWCPAELLLAITDLEGMPALFAHPKAAWGLVIGPGLPGTGVAYILYYFIVDRLGARWWRY